tara:strand:+ start:156583 stop:161193 length:4611 start_codon:yes stop_codon:yes gene_type:complete
LLKLVNNKKIFTLKASGNKEVRANSFRIRFLIKMKARKNKYNSLLIIFTCLFSIIRGISAYSQITILEPNLNFTQACASEGFNTYEFTFSFYPAQNLGATNQFIVELSDASGTFTSPTPVANLTNTSSPISADFSLPTDTGGENYRIRVRSTDPIAISEPSDYFSAYYAIHNIPYSINNYNSQVNLCEGESYLLAIDDSGTPASPVYYPFLTYIWYKDFVEIPNENGASIEITEPGSYYSIVDYGSCVMNSYSNIVTVNISPTIDPRIATADGGTTICLPQGKVLSSDTQSATYTYIWYRDGQPIANSNNPTYTATEEGSYFVEIDDLGCSSFSNTLVLDVDDFQLTLDNNQDQMLLPGETISISASTTAQTYTTQWYKDNTPIPGEDQLSINITEPGTYKIVVSQSAPCASEKEASTTIVFPDSFNLSIDTEPLYIACTTTNTQLRITQFEAVSSIETRDLLGISLGYTYQWFKNNSSISGATNTTYTIPDASENGSYNLDIIIPNYGTISSNNEVVNLGIGPVTLTNQGPFCEGQTTVLTSNITNVLYNYQWFKNGSFINGATSETYTVLDEGSYYLEINSGSCTTQSDTLTLEYGAISVSSSSPTNDFIIPGQVKELSVTTDAVQPTYQWYRDEIVINGATNDSYNATQEGIYKVIVTQTSGCTVEEELSFTLEYPLGFTIVISPSLEYEACNSSTTQLIITEFNAQTSNGDVDLLNNTYGYSYQWSKNNTPINGATDIFYNVSDASDNGDYSLSVSIPGFNSIDSNTLTIDLGLENPITISNQNPLCPGETTLLEANISGSNYMYQWFKDGAIIPSATTETFRASEEGNYTLNVESGNCTYTSNVLSLTYGDISISSSTPELNILFPGETNTITISTNALQPTYQWYKNNVIIPGEESSTITISEPGAYKVVVTQTQDCIVEAEKTFQFDAPTDYIITISEEIGYNECTSESLELNLSTFDAVTPNGNIDLLNNPDIPYTLQWYKDDIIISNENETSIVLYETSENGMYKLEMNIQDFGVIQSNEIDVNLDLNTPLQITSNGLLCENDPQVVINSNIVNSAYSYSWYKNGSLIETSNQTSITVTTEGSYSLTIDTGNCTKESNTLIIEESSITLETEMPLTNVLIPGDSHTLSVTTNALQPAYQWYENNALLEGENTKELTINTAGIYKVVVIQTIGCILEKELIFEIKYPDNFNLVIQPDVNYQECSSTQTTLSIKEFSAETENGSIDLTNNPYRYNLQWFKDGVSIEGATELTLDISEYRNNGEYYLEIDVPDYGIVSSNKLEVFLAFINSVSISSEGILCESNSEVVLTSNITNLEYNYEWYSIDSDTILNTTPELTVTEEGSYFLIVSYEGCEIVSNTETITILDSSIVTLDYPSEIDLLENTSLIVTASGADTYTWYFNNEVISTSAEVEIIAPGTYYLIALVESCEVTKEIQVTEIENNAVAIPNVVTLNGDGINDVWGLPNKYVGKEDIEVIIYGSDGAVVFRDQNYMNNWPESSFKVSPKQSVYYYTILEDNSITQKGTITIIK